VQGVNWESVSIGDNAQALSMLRGFSFSQSRQVQQLV
jgi:hypothetical protein